MPNNKGITILIKFGLSFLMSFSNSPIETLRFNDHVETLYAKPVVSGKVNYIIQLEAQVPYNQLYATS